MPRLLLGAALAMIAGGGTYGGIAKARAVEAAKAYVVRVDYRGNERLFYRDTGSRPAVVRRARDAGGRRAWFVRFDDFQTSSRYCVTVRRHAVRLITRPARC